MVNVYFPAVPAAGVPLKVAVPFPLSTNATPDGSFAVAGIERFGFGTPVVVTVKVPGTATVNWVLLRLVMAGATPRVNVNAC
jgi:hypothetical protein